MPGMPPQMQAAPVPVSAPSPMLPSVPPYIPPSAPPPTGGTGGLPAPPPMLKR
jgi:hypothetical protein